MHFDFALPLDGDLRAGFEDYKVMVEVLPGSTPQGCRLWFKDYHYTVGSGIAQGLYNRCTKFANAFVLILFLGFICCFNKLWRLPNASRLLVSFG